MDFDEYEYLEKTVEAFAAPANGSSPPGSGYKDKERSSRRRSTGGDEERDNVERRSKRSRPEEGRDRDRERHRYRDGDRHRSSRERRDRDRDVKEKEQGRENDKDRRSRDREREKEEREKDRQRRSRSRSERRRDDEERDRYRERDVRRRKEEVAEPEVDPERDQRTVFAYQLSLKADERDVYEFFSRAGKVRDVRLIMDRNSRRSKGVGYIEFYDAMSVPMAIALSGQLLLGQQVMVKPSEAEKNLVQSNASSGAASGGARKLYVGNLHSNINEDQLRQVFEPFGQVELVQLPLDPLSGLCKGFGFVQFARLEDAKAAQSLNGQLEIAGRVIKVSAVTDQAGMQVSGATGDLDDEEAGGLALNASSRALLMQKLDRSGITTSLLTGHANLLCSCSLTGGTGIAGLTTPVAIPTVSVLGAAPAAAPLLHPTVPGLAIPGATLPITTPSIDLAPPSQCLLLKNMFDPALETDPDFDLDIRDDVQEECSKFGQLKHIFVDK
ncbi:Splicing factor CC1-like [Zea mays]|nr:Splicing factor CC1-like [Zea mays]